MEQVKRCMENMNRQIDDLGRIVIPKEIRKRLNITPNDVIEINIVGNAIQLRKVLTKKEIYAEIARLQQELEKMD